MEYRDETTSIHGSWPIEQWRWKHETAAIMPTFLAALKERKVLGLKCPACGLVYSPPKAFCRCLAVPDEWVEVADTGVITTFTFTGSWSFGGMAGGSGEPMVLTGIKLDGADTQTLSVLVGAKPEQVAVGMRVRMKWPEVPTGTINDAMQCELI